MSVRVHVQEGVVNNKIWPFNVFACTSLARLQPIQHELQVLMCEQVTGYFEEMYGPCVWVIRLSQAGPLVAWSIGLDNMLVCTDMTTCQTRTSTNPS
jgi:hypothetical protein